MIQYSFTGYMIASAIILIVCVIAYRLLLENKIHPSTNRFILLSIYAISFIVPLLSVLLPDIINKPGIEIEMPEFVGAVSNFSEEPEGLKFQLSEILLWISWIYFFGVFLTFIFSLLTIGHLLFLMQKSNKIVIADVEVYVHDNKKLSSFSWGNKIFLFKGSLNSELKDLRMLVAHEKVHLDKGHWMDLVWAQIVLIFQWFNPAAWFMKNELQRIHEYEADYLVLQSGINEKDYQMLLIQNISGNRYSGLTDGLNNCSLKKRIIMMKKTKFKKNRVVRGIAVCGFAILGGFIIHIPAVASLVEDTSKSLETKEKTIVVTENSQGNKSETDVSYYLDGIKTEKENLASLNSSSIQEMTIDKTSENTKVNITTKNSNYEVNLTNQDNSINKKRVINENYPDAYVSVDKEAKYEGGQSQLLRDLSMSVRYPIEAYEKGIQGTVVVRFQINTNGSISNCEVASSDNSIFNESALKAVESLPGKWKAAEVEGKPVASVYNLPIIYKLQ